MRRTHASSLRNVPIPVFTVAVAMMSGSCTAMPEPVVADPGPPLPVVEHVIMQEILTPLPLRVRLPARYAAEHVLVFVLMWG
ncbi:MAG TPA: hypothetical protein PK156_46430, partial [Polyangium sp.]|nr:hypothetical protein [Polyangium sp.]